MKNSAEWSKRNIKKVASADQLRAMYERMRKNCNPNATPAPTPRTSRRGGGGALMIASAFTRMLCGLNDELGQSEEAKDGGSSPTTSIEKATAREELHTNGQ